MNILKVQTSVIERLLNPDTKDSVRYCRNDNFIGICFDGGACYLIPKSNFYLDITNVREFNFDNLFESKYWKLATLATMDSETYRLSKNGIDRKVIRFENKGYDIFIDSKYLKYFSKRDNVSFYTSKSCRSVLYVIENRYSDMPCIENVVAAIAPIIPSAELINEVERRRSQNV